MRYSRISNCNRQTDRRTEQTNIRTCRPGSLQLKINMTYQVNLTKVSPIKMESITMISEYLPVGIAKLNVNNVWIKGAALFLGIFQILHFQRVENRNIWKTVLKVKKLLNFIWIFIITVKGRNTFSFFSWYTFTWNFINFSIF